MANLEKAAHGELSGFLRGERVSLFPLAEDHKQLYYRWHNSTDVRLYFGNSLPVSMARVEKMIQTPPERGVHFEIRLTGENRPIGMAQISNIHWIRRKCTIGALIALAQDRRKGYAKEVVGLLVDYIFGELNLNKISVIIYRPNIASQKVVEALGFRLEAQISDAGYFDGEYCEDLYYGMSQSEWRQAHKP